MATSAQSLVDRVAGDLNDDAHRHWSEADLLNYLNDGQRAAVLLRPDVNPVTETVPLVRGTKQSIPDQAYVLIDCIRIHTYVGAGMDPTPAQAVTAVTRADLDQTVPEWAMEGGGPVNQFVYDVRNRRTFYVYPQPIMGDPDLDAGDNSHIELVHAKIPDYVDAVGDDITIDDIYTPALLAYMFHRAYLKDVAAEAQGVGKGREFWTLFTDLLLGRAAEEEEKLIVPMPALEVNIQNRNRLRT